jgi:hypothetical protein
LDWRTFIRPTITLLIVVMLTTVSLCGPQHGDPFPAPPPCNSAPWTDAGNLLSDPHYRSQAV